MTTKTDLSMGNAPTSINDDVLGAFAMQQNKNDMVEILRELFDMGKIFSITELSNDEIRLLTRIWSLGKMKKYPLYIEIITFYVTAKLSSKRKSRKEIIDAFSGFMRQQGGFLGKLNPANWGGNRGRM